MPLAGLMTLYKVYKDSKKGIKAVTGSGAYKILTYSQQVDSLIVKYKAARVTNNQTTIKSIRAELKTIREGLMKLANSVPAIPKFSKKVALDVVQNVLDAQNTSQMAQLEIMRINMDQLNGDLPEDEMDNWPATRLRFGQARDQFARAAVGFRQEAGRIEKEIGQAGDQQTELRSIKDDKHTAKEDIDDLEQQFNEWAKIEADLKDGKGRFLAMAELSEKTAERFAFLIESGDLKRGIKK